MNALSKWEKRLRDAVGPLGSHGAVFERKHEMAHVSLMPNTGGGAETSSRAGLNTYEINARLTGEILSVLLSGRGEGLSHCKGQLNDSS